MSSTTETAAAPDADRRTKPRLGLRGRALTVTGILLALVGGTVAGAGVASAQAPPGACTQTCNAPPQGVSANDWNQALRAADFWANDYIDYNSVARPQWSQSYFVLQRWNGHGWPGQAQGRNWYAYHNGNDPWGNTIWGYVYYGGRYNDYNGLVTYFEGFHGGNANTAYPTGNGRTAPYVEYDINGYGAPGAQRDAWRLVRNPNTGNVYATFDHYTNFYYLGRF